MRKTAQFAIAVVGMLAFGMAFDLWQHGDIFRHTSQSGGALVFAMIALPIVGIIALVQKLRGGMARAAQPRRPG